MRSFRILTLVGLLLSSAQSWAMSGKVQFLDGELFAGEGPDAKPLKQGDAVAGGSTVVLKKGRTAILALDNGATIKLKDASRIVLTQDPIPTVDLKQGAVFSEVAKAKGVPPAGPAGLKPRFVIRTKSATMGVRGTEFFTSTSEGENIWMCVHEGQVEVRKNAGGAAVTVHEGEGVVIEPSKEIAPPKVYEWTKKLNWNLDPKKGEVKDDSSLDGEYKNLLKQTYD